jgi:tryptophanyl-tRNA synthetase
MRNKTILSGVQPSGILHIGNYLGAIKNWVKLQEDYFSLFCIVDHHAITVKQDPKELRKNILNTAKIYLAAGVEPKDNIIFIQSQVPQHTELCWILNTIANISELKKMTQFKDKAGISKKTIAASKYITKDIKKIDKKLIEALQIVEKDGEKAYAILMDIKINILPNISTNVDAGEIFEDGLAEIADKRVGVGLFDYPVLMAADILLYQTDLVPVGDDQTQHIELTRTLANRFNKTFGQTFKIPQSYIQDRGGRIMGLDDPNKKMSKSAASTFNYIALTDDPDTVKKKISKAVTDSGTEIKFDPKRSAIYNLLTIYLLLTDLSKEKIESKFAGKGYGDFKKELADVIIEFLKPFQEKLNSIKDEEVLKILEDGRKKATKIAEKTMKEVKAKIGFLI